MENKELLDWSKNHIKYLKNSINWLDSIIKSQWENNETIKVDVGDLLHINQLMVDSVDIISLLNNKQINNN